MDIADGKVVKGTNFTQLTQAGDAVELAKLYCKMGVDELVFLDITATIEKRQALTNLVRRIAAEIDIPFTVGGGINLLEDIKLLLDSGADKVSIGSAAVTNPELIKQAALQFGSQCIAISVDPKQTQAGWEIYIKGGREATGIDAIEFCKQMQDYGAGELLVNSLDRDGTKQGYDLDLLNAVSQQVNIPVIASSGVGKKEHFLEVFEETSVEAALAASVFHYGDLTINEVKEYLNQNNVLVRLI